MFDTLSQLPADPILGLISQFSQDERSQKIDLGVGVYRNTQGHTPILSAVKQAEQMLLTSEHTKAYIGPVGDAVFNRSMAELVLGKQHTALERMTMVQTPGGCGALRVAAELIKRTHADATIWVSDPTWGNHIPLLGDAGVTIKTYPYYNFNDHRLCFEAMFSCLEKVKAGDLVLLHGCCHNPSGTDLNTEHWQALVSLALRKGFVPFIDMAYQGFGEGIDEDASGFRLMCEQLPEVLLAVSCSKNFGLYRERVGAVGVVSAKKAIVESHIASIVRGIYSMPPSHGAAIVAAILSSEILRPLWERELGEMRERIQQVRKELVSSMNTLGAEGQFDHIARQSGMFSFLGLTETAVAALAKDFGIYMVASGRVSLAGLNPSNINTFCGALNKVRLR